MGLSGLVNKLGKVLIFSGLLAFTPHTLPADSSANSRNADYQRALSEAYERRKIEAEDTVRKLEGEVKNLKSPAEIKAREEAISKWREEVRRLSNEVNNARDKMGEAEKRINLEVQNPLNQSHSQQFSEEELRKKKYMDLDGHLITRAHYLTYGRKQLSKIIEETYNSLGVPIYNYQDMFTKIEPQQDVSSDDWLFFGFLSGLLSGSPAATPRQSFALDVASSTLGNAAQIQGQKEAANIIAGNNNQPYLRQNFIPQGRNGVCAVRYPRGGECLFIVSDKPWEDIDRNGLGSINEFHPRSDFPKGGEIHLLGQTASDEKQPLFCKIFKDGKEDRVIQSPSFTLTFPDGEGVAGSYSALWYYLDGRMMAMVPFQVGSLSVQNNSSAAPLSSADPDARLYVFEDWYDSNNNGMMDLPNECVRIRNDRPVKINIKRGNDTYFCINYSERSIGGSSVLKVCKNGNELENESQVSIARDKGIHVTKIPGENLAKAGEIFQPGINKRTLTWYINGKYVNSLEIEIEK